MSQFWKITLLVMCCLLITAPAAFGQSQTFVVDDDGDPLLTYPDLTTAVATALTFTGTHRIEIRAGAYSDVGVTFTGSPGVIGEVVGDDKATVIFTAPVFQTGVCLDPSGTTDLSISGISVVSYQYGMRTLSSGCSGLHLFDCIFDDNGVDGYAVNGVDDLGGAIRVHGTGCLIENVEAMNGERGIRFGNGYATSMADNTVRNCQSHDNEQYGVYFSGAGSADMTGSVVEGCEVYNNDDYGIQFWPQGATCDVTVTGNIVQGNLWSGILVANADGGGTVSGNTVTGNCVSGTSPIGKVNSPLVDADAAGIELKGACDGVSVTDNAVSGNGDGLGFGDYGINLSSASISNQIRDNCLFGHASAAQGKDEGGAASNVWRDNYFDDLSGNPSFPDYLLDGSAGEIDIRPWLYDNSASGPAIVEVLDIVDIDFNWTVPSCAGNSAKKLAAYEFTVSWDPAKLSYISADYDDAYLGDNAAGALYTAIGGDPVTGSLVFAATNFTAPGEGDGRLAFAQFEATDVGAVSITVSSDYRDENTDPIPTGTAPLDIDIQDTGDPVVVSFTQNNPMGDDTYSDGGPGVDLPHVELWVEAQATDNFDLNRIKYSLDGGGFINLVTGLSGMSGGTAGPVYIDITGLGVGAHTMDVRAQDNGVPSVNFSALETYNFTIDRTGPSLTGVLLSDADDCAVDPDFTNATTVDVDLTDGGDATMMQIFESGWQTPIAYANPTSYTFLNVAEGAKTIYYRLFDKYGNEGNQLSDAITLDLTEPAPGGPLTLAGGAAKTNVPLVAFSLSSWGDGVEYNISETPADFVCGDAGWTPVSPGPYNITLSTGDGPKTVHLAVRDEAGNIGSTTLMDDIVLDQTGPAVTSVLVTDPSGDGAGGDDCTDTYLVDVEVTFAATDVVWIRFSNDAGAETVYGDGSTPMTSPFSGTHTMTGSPASDQVMTIDVELEDDSKPAPGNTESGSDDIYLDYDDPALTGVVIVDAAATDAPLANSDWSNDLTVDLELSGLVDDVIELVFSQDNFVTADTVDVSGDSPFPDPYVYSYTYQGAPTECSGVTVWVMSMDCAGNKSGGQSDAIWFDLTLPTFTAFTGPALTNSLSVSLSLTAADNCNMFQMRIAEDDPTFASVSWEPFNASPTFALDDKSPASNDVSRILYAEVADAAGNIDAAVLQLEIDVDMTDPTGSMIVQQIPAMNPLALPGYTNSETGIEAVSIAADGDVVDMQIQAVSCPGAPAGSNSGWVSLATSYIPIALDITCGEGSQTVRIRFKDGAGNIGAWVNSTIIYDMTPPSPPLTAMSMPGGSQDLTWSAVADAASYILRFNFNGDYPFYAANNPPPNPAWGEGIAIPEGEIAVPAVSHSFEGSGPDIRSFSIWARDSAGNVDPASYATVSGTNYLLGDFWDSDSSVLGPDGCIDFADEFGQLANAYNSGPLDVNWNEHLDIAPTSDGNPLSRPVPDSYVGFEDLIIFALNYVDNRCAGNAAPKSSPYKFSPAQPVAITTDLPSRVGVGDEVTIPIRIEYAAAVRGFHVVLDYNRDDFDLIGIQAGAAYQSIKRSFFYYDQDASTIDVSGANLETEAVFEDGELFSVRLRSKTGYGVELSASALTFRDHENLDISVDFDVHVIAAAAVPTSFALDQNYPNPFNPATTIRMYIPTESEYTLEIFNVLGQSVAVFRDRAPVGVVNITWDGAGQPTGLYFYRMTAGNFQQTKKMVFLK